MGNHNERFKIMKLWNLLGFGQVPKSFIQVVLSEGEFDWGGRLNPNSHLAILQKKITAYEPFVEEKNTPFFLPFLFAQKVEKKKSSLVKIH